MTRINSVIKSQSLKHVALFLVNTLGRSKQCRSLLKARSLFGSKWARLIQGRGPNKGEPIVIKERAKHLKAKCKLVRSNNNK